MTRFIFWPSRCAALARQRCGSKQELRGLPQYNTDGRDQAKGSISVFLQAEWNLLISSMEVAFAVVGATDVAGRAGSKLYALYSAWRDAPADVHRLRDDVTRTERFFA